MSLNIFSGKYAKRRISSAGRSFLRLYVFEVEQMNMDYSRKHYVCFFINTLFVPSYCYLPLKKSIYLPHNAVFCYDITLQYGIQYKTYFENFHNNNVMYSATSISQYNRREWQWYQLLTTHISVLGNAKEFQVISHRTYMIQELMRVHAFKVIRPSCNNCI